MLPKAARMRSSDEFSAAVRHGVRTGRGTVVVHVGEPVDGGPSEPVLVGFVVSKAVGNAVVRNRVKRRLRHLAVSALPVTPPGTRVVVRALPRAASHPHEVPDDLHLAWDKALHRLAERQRRGSRRAAP